MPPWYIDRQLGNPTRIKYEEDEYYEDDFVFAEHSFLEIYNLNFTHGDPSTALSGSNELIINTTTAKKFFGDDDPIGKRLNLNGFRDLEVIGVFEDLPDNTHLQLTLIASFETFKTFFNNPAFFDTQWVWVAAWMYFTVEDELMAKHISSQMGEFVKRHYPEVLADKGVVLHVQKANDVHLTSHRELEFKANGKIQHVYLFSAIAILILLIAVINFMNLTTSRSVKRAKEVGLRKVMGAYKQMLIFQFLGEALLTVFISLIIAIALISFALPWFNNLTGKNIVFDILHNPSLLIGIILLVGIVGILSGSYPALVLSSFNPTQVLKGNSIGNSSGNILRKTLVVIQFVVSISLIICIGIVYKQLNYIHSKDMGFNTEQIILADMNFNFFNRYNGFKTELTRNPEIQAVSMLGGSIPGQEELIENAFVPTGTPADEQQWFSTSFAGHDFEQVLNIEFIHGHSFKVGSAVDSAGFIITESTARALGWELDDVIGQSLDRLNSSNGTIINTGQVIGVVKDFHYRPLYEPIKPLVIGMGGGKLCIKIKSEDLPGTIKLIEKQWNSQFESTPFRYSFMDTDFDALYAKEDKFSKTIQYFSILAIFIACLGLLGLSSYATESRKKEIGIRKVNGATAIGLLGLLTKDFSKLILIAFIISIPVSYYFAGLWLDNFAYQTNIGVFIFIIAGIIAFGVAILTIGYHTLKAALSNPVEALRYE